MRGASVSRLFLYEAGVDLLIAMKFVGHTDYKTTASTWGKILRKAAVNMGVREEGGKWISWNYEDSGQIARSRCRQN